MPLTSVYNLGSASFTAGSVNVVGVGTNWIGAGIREGDMFWADGLLVRVLTLVDNTHLTLAYAWPGTTKTGSAYEIHYTHDSERVLATSTQLLSDLNATALNPLKAITPANDRIAYYTGAATAALATLTSKARQILALTTNTQILTNLGIVLQDSRYDSVAGRMLQTGAFGLGSTSGQDVTNIDDVSQPTSFFTVNPSTVTGTLPASTGAKDGVLHIKITATIAVQIYFSAHSSSPAYYRRSTGSATWQAWRMIQME